MKIEIDENEEAHRELLETRNTVSDVGGRRINPSEYSRTTGFASNDNARVSIPQLKLSGSD